MRQQVRACLQFVRVHRSRARGVLNKLIKDQVVDIFAMCYSTWRTEVVQIEMNWSSTGYILHSFTVDAPSQDGRRLDVQRLVLVAESVLIALVSYQTNCSNDQQSRA